MYLVINGEVLVSAELLNKKNNTLGIEEAECALYYTAV